MRVLALEPFFGGSHRAFLEGWQAHFPSSLTLVSLPAKKWKWRMRQSPLVFAREIESRIDAGQAWDICFASDMLPLAELKGLMGPRLALPTVLYFHENQLTYPERFPKDRDYHFPITNLTSAAAADEVWFNSAFHRDDMLGAIPRFFAACPTIGRCTLPR